MNDTGVVAQQVVAHVLCIAHRYQAIAEGRDFHRAGQPRELDQINQDELEAAIAPIPDLVDQLEALAPVMDAYFDDLADEYAVEFHCNIAVSGTISQINWLFELVLHGDDIARATGAPWKIRERDMLFILRECIEVAPGYLRGDIPLVTDISVALQIPHGRPYVMHVHDGIAEAHARQPSDRPDVVLKAPASTMARLLLHRIGPFAATRQGLRIVGGRRPWKAMKLLSAFERA